VPILKEEILLNFTSQETKTVSYITEVQSIGSGVSATDLGHLCFTLQRKDGERKIPQ
jgi:hypothetical protein